MKKGTKAQSRKATENKINLRTLIRSFSVPRAARATGIAKKHLAVFLAVAFSVATLAGAILPKNQFQSLKEKLIRQPDDFEAHLQLAEKFLANNQLPEAERALALAQNLQLRTSNLEQSSQVLGEQTESKLSELWQQKQYADPQDVRRLIAAWEKIMMEKPDYRDGWLQLAILHYKLYENDLAKENLQKALSIDPNYAPAKELEEVIH